MSGVLSSTEAGPGVVEPGPERLAGAVGSELEVDPRELGDEQLGARCLRLRAERDRLEVAIARADAALEETGAYHRLDAGCTKAWHWLAEHGRVPAKEARRAFRQGAG